MREGSLEAPTRHPIDWKDADFYDRVKIDAEMRRVFEICHGCRRCFNLCDSFPRLFDMIDNSATGDVDVTADINSIAPDSSEALTFAIKDITLDLRAHVEFAKSEIRIRPAGANDAEASVFHLVFAAITRPMIEENAVALTSEVEVAPVDMDFTYDEVFGETSAPAYETLLLDVMIGEATLFTRSDEVEAAWRVIDPLIRYWEEHPPDQMPTYAAGTWGPREAEELIQKDGIRWREP